MPPWTRPCFPALRSSLVAATAPCPGLKMLRRLLSTAHYTPRTTHCALHTAHCTPHTAHYTVYAASCSVGAPRGTGWSVFSAGAGSSGLWAECGGVSSGQWTRGRRVVHASASQVTGEGPGKKSCDSFGSSKKPVSYFRLCDASLRCCKSDRWKLTVTLVTAEWRAGPRESLLNGGAGVKQGMRWPGGLWSWSPALTRLFRSVAGRRTSPPPWWVGLEGAAQCRLLNFYN